MKYVIVLLHVAAILVAPAVSASTIVCKDIRASSVDWVESHAPIADLIILGTVINERYIQPPVERVDSAERANVQESIEELRRANEAHHPYQEVTFNVEKIWKGAELEKVTARQKVIPGVIGNLLYGTKTYLVFGYKLPDDTYVFSTVCGQTKPQEIAGDQIEALDKLFQTSG